MNEVIDAHAHIVPESLLTDSAFRRTDKGWVFSAPGIGETRPIGPRMTNVDARRSWLADTGVTRQILSPWLDIQENGRDWALRLNDAMCESADELGTAALASVDTTDADQAAQDLVDAINVPQLVGLMLSTDPLNGPPLHSDHYAPLWMAAVEHQAPIMLHPSTCGPHGGLGNVHGRLVDNTLALGNLILNGVFDRFPGLQLLAVHGGGFLPYQAGRLDGGYRTGETKVADLERGQPSAYLQDFYYDTVALTAPAIAFLTENVAPGRVMLGSDYPFAIGDPQPATTVRNAALTEHLTDSVMRGAAVDLFGKIS
ncbi:amidohydrolase [Kibdelosporangium philippinense]|uniref:Amidohydrolase n=1 Tax=Kibdelosporangium philippinense TaxID=211113 RepID=A0ABS8Z8A8_9PSEU|nr:amidohydrolase family protein [Kibdelosporangium philippinense]MCE7002067.1 amidohydrolase [Kibdelosporangium philippinense]